MNAGLSQEDVAKILDVNQAAVSYWESGKTTPVKKYRRKLARLYGCAEDDLLRQDSA